MCIGRCQRHSQPSNDPNVGLRLRDPRDGTSGKFQELSPSDFHCALPGSARAGGMLPELPTHAKEGRQQGAQRQGFDDFMLQCIRPFVAHTVEPLQCSIPSA